MCHTGQFKYMYLLQVVLAPPVWRVYTHSLTLFHPHCIHNTWMVSGVPVDEGKAVLGRAHTRSLVILTSDLIPTIIQKWCAWIPVPFILCTRDGATSLTMRKRVLKLIINWRKSQNQRLLYNSGSAKNPVKSLWFWDHLQVLLNTRWFLLPDYSMHVEPQNCEG